MAQFAGTQMTTALTLQEVSRLIEDARRQNEIIIQQLQQQLNYLIQTKHEQSRNMNLRQQTIPEKNAFVSNSSGASAAGPPSPQLNTTYNVIRNGGPESVLAPSTPTPPSRPHQDQVTYSLPGSSAEDGTDGSGGARDSTFRRGTKYPGKSSPEQYNDYSDETYTQDGSSSPSRLHHLPNAQSSMFNAATNEFPIERGPISPASYDRNPSPVGPPPDRTILTKSSKCKLTPGSGATNISTGNTTPNLNDTYTVEPPIQRGRQVVKCPECNANVLIVFAVHHLPSDNE